MIEFGKILLDDRHETLRISCPEYIEDLDRLIKMPKRQCQEQTHDISGFLKISKNDNSLPKKKRENTISIF